ncbi:MULTISPECIES: hypothetical protein [Aerococcus]|uniref:Uncharacterized protein n=2 Tax=Aerococcus TaxID=1375 RepID=A0A5N1GG29_9LACT|nr:MULTISPECIES: hypothetical protein [Aerococcus]KAA9299266.1 hypothetical protein F6I03_09375 [Aerococcus sanguinicola]MDK6370110.1 hypothetical protein [Aerococcus sp. UMB9870]MDK6680714.1 hypothetical protein [Aerococcus sp. UMB8608]MDK6687508.1 hypothetical protein [Aerococcus sp. UMB8623]MDK6940664.1 hypothetical protein [Aerococcus sp. UMB8487]
MGFKFDITQIKGFGDRFDLAQKKGKAKPQAAKSDLAQLFSNDFLQGHSSLVSKGDLLAQVGVDSLEAMEALPSDQLDPVIASHSPYDSYEAFKLAAIRYHQA